MAEAQDQIEQVQKQADAELAAVKTPAELEQFRIKYLGSKGSIKGLMKLLGQVPKEQKPALGQKVNALNDHVTAAFTDKQASFAGANARSIFVDVTEPGLRPQIGNTHILTKVTDELTELFGRMGFSIA